MTYTDGVGYYSEKEQVLFLKKKHGVRETTYFPSKADDKSLLSKTHMFATECYGLGDVCFSFLSFGLFSGS